MDIIAMVFVLGSDPKSFLSVGIRPDSLLFSGSFELFL